MSNESQKRSTKREAIMDTALVLFVEHGYDATTIKQIAGGADTAEGNLYRHFENKQDLAQKIFLECAEKFEDKLDESIRGKKDPFDKLNGVIRGIYEFAKDFSTEFEYIMRLHIRSKVIDREILRSPMPRNVIERVVREGVSEEIFRNVEPTLVAGWLVGMVQKGVFVYQRKLSPIDYEDIINETQEASHRILAKEERRVNEPGWDSIGRIF